jgi:regulator of protease activity HflC (stomatin/prohibitin superfamily)
MSQIISLIIFTAVILVISTIFSFVKVVKQQSAFTVETFGKFSRVLMPGLNFLIPFIEMPARKVNLSTMTLDCPILAITSDKVNIKIDTSLVYKVVPSKIYQAAYALDNPVVTIRSLIDNSIRAFVATQTHEDVIKSRDEMTHYVFGYEIDSFQFRDITLPKEITEAMSRVVASKRLQEAAQNEAQAEYIRAVKTAEAQKETRYLQGQGVALEREAIIKGLADSIKGLQQEIGVSSESVLSVVMLNQYIDMLRTVGMNEKTSKVVFLNPTPQGMESIMQQVSELVK